MIDQLPSVEFLSALSPEALKQLAGASELKHFNLGDVIVEQGQTADGLHIVQSGRLRLFEQRDGKERSVGLLGSGEVFGELAALRAHHHEHAVRASGKTSLIFVPAKALRQVLKDDPEAEAFMASYAAIRAAGGIVRQLFDLKGEVDAEVLQQLVSTVGIKSVAAGEHVLRQDESEDRRLYVVLQGSLSVERHDDGNTFALGVLSRGEICGEKACMTHQPQPADVIAQTTVTLLVVPQDTMQTILTYNTRLRSLIEERIHRLEREHQRQQKVLELRQQPLLKIDSSPEARGERRLKRFPLVQQAEEMDCGAACLTMICRHHGLQMTLGKLRELVGVTREGTTLEHIARTAEGLGFEAHGVQATFGALKNFDLPFIAHWEGYHFVVVYGISEEHVWVADPGPGFRKLSREAFERGWTGTCLLLKPDQLNPSSGSSSPWRRFVSYLYPHRYTIGHMFVAALVIQLLNLAPPIITQNVFDRVIVHENTDLLFYLVVALVLAQGFAQLTTLLRGYLANFMTRSMDFAMMSSFFRHTLALPVAFFANRRTGDVVARFQENQTIRDFLTGQTVGTVLNVLMVFVYLTVMFLYDVKLTLLLLALILPIFLLTVAITPRMKAYSREMFDSSTDAEAVLMETIGAADSIKGMGIERHARLKWERRYAHALNVQYRAEGFHLLVGVASQLLNIAATVTILYVGAGMVIGGELSIGQLIAFNMLSASVMGPLMALVGLWDELHAAGVAIERLSDVLDLEPEQPANAAQQKIVLPDIQGDVRFEDVYFRYGGEDDPYVLKGVDLEMRAGEMIAVVGQSGSGKSTLAKLLVGLYPPADGRVLVDGYDLQQLELTSYRAQLGYVMQSNLLLQGTVAENIAIGDDEPDRSRILRAAQLADAHDFISGLPQGYEHRVGERGVGLSGGQVQRICIARALYRSPRILVLDEATSALDAESEGNILANMDALLEGRTALVIAHRMSTILRADRIVVLYDGSIAEMGTHNALLAQRGMYYQLVQKQMGAAA